jgi:hypothetical protein
VGGLVGEIWVVRSWMVGPVFVGYSGSIEWNYRQDLGVVNTWRRSGWVRIPYRMKGNIRIDGPSIGRNGSCGVIGGWLKGSGFKIIW